MTYRDRIFAGLDLIGMLDRTHYPTEHLISWKLLLLEATSEKRRADYQPATSYFDKLARRFVAGRDPVDDLGRRCHVYSDAFNRLFRKHVQDLPVGLFPTIGEVKYRGESVYDVTEEKVISTFQRGFQRNETLDVHVWLTFEDMTIVDLTIMASLLRLGWIDRTSYDGNPVICGKPEELSDFEYVPYLVDNDFAGRVDRFDITLPPTT